MTWTFDPLVARNAYFNIEKLGARPTHYMIEYYGQMSDGINAGQASDRVLLYLGPDRRPPPRRPGARRQTRASRCSPVSSQGRPQQHDHLPTDCAQVTIGIPSDIERLRRENAPLSHEWRVALRQTLPQLLDAGWRVTSFDRAGRYVVERSH